MHRGDSPPETEAMGSMPFYFGDGAQMRWKTLIGLSRRSFIVQLLQLNGDVSSWDGANVDGKRERSIRGQ